jgi:hypothetical protein
MPCLVCKQPSTVHHVTASIHGGRITRSHRRVVPLCNNRATGPHHQAVYDKVSGPRSVELLNHGGFYLKYGIDLLAEAERLWKEGSDVR